MDYSLLGASVHGILQARILEWVEVPSVGDHPDLGIESMSPALQAYIWKVSVHILLKPHLENFEHYFVSM